MYKRIAANILVFMLFLYIGSAVTYWAIGTFDVAQDASPDMGYYFSIYNKADLDTIPKPFRYRIFTPILARYVPFLPNMIAQFFDINDDEIMLFKFGVVNIIGISVAAFCLFIFLLTFDFSVLEAMVGALVYLTGFYLINWTAAPMVDAMAHAFIMLGVLAIRQKRNLMLSLAVLIGMFAKEVILLVPVSIPLLNREKRDTFIQLGFALPGILFYFMIRSYCFPTSIGYDYPFVKIFQNFFSYLVPQKRHLMDALEIALVYGPFWILALKGFHICYKQNNNVLIRFSLLILIPFAACFIILESFGRILFLSFPAVIPLIVVGIRSLAAAMTQSKHGSV